MTARALRMLYREVPEVKGCLTGCGKCCGPVPWSPAELERVASRIPPGTLSRPAPSGPTEMVMLINPVTGGCAMLDAEKRCTVYEARPLMCRMFGAVAGPGLECPFGARAGRPLSDRKAGALAQRYKREAP
jgi:Fe-S-cluster containining protein